MASLHQPVTAGDVHTRTPLNNPDLEQKLIKTLKAVGGLPMIGLDSVIQPSFIVGSAVTPEALTPRANFLTYSATQTAGLVLTDTGALEAGTYECSITYQTIDTANTRALLQHRNAANAANVWVHTMASVDAVIYENRFCIDILQDERVRVEAVNNAGNQSYVLFKYSKIG